MYFAEAFADHKVEEFKWIVRLLEEFQARFDHFQELKPCFAFLVNPFNVNVSVMAVQLVTVYYKLVCCRKKTDRNARNSGSKNNFSQCHSALNFWRHVPESEYQEFKIPVYNSFLCIAQNIAVNFFLCNEVPKIIPPRNPEKWTLGRINSYSFNNILSRFSGTRKSNKNFIPTTAVHHLK